MTRSSRASDGLIYLRGLNEVVRTVTGQEARYSVPENPERLVYAYQSAGRSTKARMLGVVCLSVMSRCSDSNLRQDKALGTFTPQSAFLSQINSRGQGMVHDSQLHATGYSVWSCAALSCCSRSITHLNSHFLAAASRHAKRKHRRACLAGRAADLRRPDAAAHNPRSTDCRRTTRRGKRGCTARRTPRSYWLGVDASNS
jgi:hypothetical protein